MGAPVRATRTMRVIRTPAGIELYFPAGRMPEVALPLAVFGVIAAAIPIAAVAAFLPSLGEPSSLLGAVLVAAFALPFAAFGVLFVALAIYMATNGLHVRVDREGIETVRSVLGGVVKRRRIAHAEIGAIEPEIASRYQSLFAADPVYQLIARDRARTQRIIVAETLVGEALMEEVKALIGIYHREQPANG